MWLASRRQQLVSVLFHFWITVIMCVNYEELQQLEVSCPPVDTCGSTSRIDSWYINTCSCDQSCVHEHTCCVDSPYNHLALSRPTERCMNTRFRAFSCYQSYWFITKCSPSWNGSSSVKELCEDDGFNSSNLYTYVPAVSNVSGSMYQNYFCAVCNNDHQEAVLWNVDIKRKLYMSSFGLEEHENASHELVYEKDINEWGFWIKLSVKGFVFIPVDVNIDCNNIGRVFLDANVCRNDIAWSCAEDWEDNGVREKCESYMALLSRPVTNYGNLKSSFRNVHCAICNHVTELQELMCRPYNITMPGGYGGGAGGSGFGGTIPNQFGHNLETKLLRTEDCLYFPKDKKCRPVVSFTKKS